MTEGKKGRKDLTGIKMGIVVALFAIALGALWVRTGWVQLHDGDTLASRASRQSLADECEYGERGRIFDRNGEMLATSVEAKSVFVRPYEIENIDVAADVLSRDLKMRRITVYKKLKSKRKFVWIKRQITDREAAAITKAGLDGVRLTSEFTRIYPNGHLAGQLLGFVDIDGHGREGIEKVFDKQLAPKKAKFVVQRDATGHRLYLDAKGREVNINGQDVQLTIDTQIQHAAELALANSVTKYEARAGIVIVVDVHSGDILAIANDPFFNPNDVRHSKSYQRRLRALTDIYEPGSTMKPLLFAAALDKGIITPDTIIDCEGGRWRVARRIIRDTHPKKWLPAHKVLCYSSNIGSAKIGTMLGPQYYHDFLTRLGFGSKTDIGLPGEASGILRPASKWTSVDMACISFGQSIGVTAIQLAHAFLCLANMGATKDLNLVKTPAPARRNASVQVFSPETAAKVLTMMEEVVEGDGTGRSARIKGIDVAGKTGTAQKASPNGGYGDQYLSSFVALVPAKDPDLLVITMIDEPQKGNYGSMVAAPVCREITVRTLAYNGELSETLHADSEEQILPTEDLTEPLTQSVAVPAIADTSNKVPDIKGLPVRRAVELLTKRGIVPVLKGRGMTVERQQPAPGQPWPDAKNKEGADVFILWLS